MYQANHAEKKMELRNLHPDACQFALMVGTDDLFALYCQGGCKEGTGKKLIPLVFECKLLSFELFKSMFQQKFSHYPMFAIFSKFCSAVHHFF